MPGIVGLITQMPRAQAELQLLRMVESMRHESFYVAGTWIDESLGVYVGWVERKNSFADAMPIQNEKGDVVLIFSGEEYPPPDRIKSLKDHGHTFDAEGPAYLVHLYEEDAGAFPVELNGRFHGLLVDRRRAMATLFNDRYGMQRIYYHEAKEAFYFAAEAKAILAVRKELRNPDPRGLGEFISTGCVLENRTLFQGIFVLPGGSAWRFQNGVVEGKASYFRPREWEEQTPLEPEAYYQQLCHVFSQSLPHYFNGREAIAVSLTGGLDTRIIMAWRKAPPQSLPCYTYGGMYRDCQDVIVARRVAHACQQSHEVIPVGNEFLSKFPYYAERSVFLTDGCTNLSRSPDLYLSEKVRAIAPVRMVGTYGSEIVTRVPVFKPEEPLNGLFRKEFLFHIRQAKATYTDLLLEHPVTFTAFRQSPWYHFGVLALEQTQIGVRSPYLDNEFVRTVFRAPKSSASDSDVRLRMIADGDPNLARIPTDRGVGGDRGPISSAAARRFQEFTFKAEYAYDNGMPQWLAQMDHAVSSLHLERLFLGRHKLFHFRTWYRDILSGYVREMLLDSRTLSRPYLERKGVESIVKGHIKGNRNYTVEIHNLLALELMHRAFFDAQ